MKKNRITVFTGVLVLFSLNLVAPYTSSLCAQPVEFVNAFPNLNFSSPVFLTSSQDGSNRIFVIEQPGVIRVFANDSTTATTETFLDIKDDITYGGEMGLLGLAFHPEFRNKGLFYINYTTTQNGPRRTVVSEFSASGNQANPNSERVLLEIDQFAGNHNGGMLAFGPDGYLYIGLGDGGGGSDPGNNGQDKTSLLATILRIDVDKKDPGIEYAIPPDNPFVGEGGGVRGEIFAFGLRNPWRFSFDTQTNRLWAGDVGQNRLEEINIVESGGNYGWPRMEGLDCFDQNNPNNPPASCNQDGLTLPVKDYSHSLGCSVTGGYIYRGARRPELEGAYIYGDYCSGLIWILRYENGVVVADSLLTDSFLSISSFGVDESGELYVIHLNGQIYRFKASIPTAVAGQNNRTETFGLAQNFPNPFNPETRIRYQLPGPGFVELSIINSLGENICLLVNEQKALGEYYVNWDGRDQRGKPVSGGIYFYKLQVGKFIQIKKMILMH